MGCVPDLYLILARARAPPDSRKCDPRTETSWGFKLMLEHPRSRLQHPRSWLQHPHSRLQHPHSRLLYPRSPEYLHSRRSLTATTVHTETNGNGCEVGIIL